MGNVLLGPCLPAPFEPPTTNHTDRVKRFLRMACEFGDARSCEYVPLIRAIVSWMRLFDFDTFIKWNASYPTTFSKITTVIEAAKAMGHTVSYSVTYVDEKKCIRRLVGIAMRS